MSTNLRSGTCDRCGQPISGECGYWLIDCLERAPEYLSGREEDTYVNICFSCQVDFMTWMYPDAKTLEAFAELRAE